MYGALFDLLAKQETEAWERASADAASSSSGSRVGASPHSYPSFGGSSASAEAVFGFYSAWGSFVSAKDFAWADLYHPGSAPNRQVRGADTRVRAVLCTHSRRGRACGVTVAVMRHARLSLPCMLLSLMSVKL